MKVRIGNMFDEWGTIETSPEGLRYTPTGAPVETLRLLVERMRGGRSDASLLRSLPARLNGYTWAEVMDETPRDDNAE